MRARAPYAGEPFELRTVDEVKAFRNSQQGRYAVLKVLSGVEITIERGYDTIVEALEKYKDQAMMDAYGMSGYGMSSYGSRKSPERKTETITLKEGEQYDISLLPTSSNNVKVNENAYIVGLGMRSLKSASDTISPILWASDKLLVESKSVQLTAVADL